MERGFFSRTFPAVKSEKLQDFQGPVETPTTKIYIWLHRHVGRDMSDKITITEESPQPHQRSLNAFHARLECITPNSNQKNNNLL